MPVYEFQCPLCSGENERLMGINDPTADLECGHCDYKGAMKRLISCPAPPQFGGPSGLARTHELIKKRNEDYRKGGRYKDERVRDVENAHRRVGLIE